MVRKYLVTAALIAAFAVPATAATMKANVYYAEQSVKTQACYVVTFKPNGKTATMIGTDSFKTFALAAAAVKADTSCKPPKMKAKPMAPAKPK
jgi:hypothetical protein